MALRRDPTRKTSDYTSSSTGGLADRSGSGLEVDVALLGPGDVLDLVSYKVTILIIAHTSIYGNNH